MRVCVTVLRAFQCDSAAAAVTNSLFSRIISTVGLEGKPSPRSTMIASRLSRSVPLRSTLYHSVRVQPTRYGCTARITITTCV